MRMKRTLLVAGLAAWASATAVGRRADAVFGGDNSPANGLQANDAIPNFANSGFNDRASSVVVRDGAWQLCDDAYFRGRCVTLQPGRYPSLREIGLEQSRVVGPRDRQLGTSRRGPGRMTGQWGGGSRAVLFPNPDFQGERFVVDGRAARSRQHRLQRPRAVAARRARLLDLLQRCQLQGDCRTFGPGDYPTLSWLDNQDLVGAPDFQRLSVQRPPQLARLSAEIIHGCRSSTTSPGCAASSRDRARIAVVGLSAQLVPAELLRREVHAGPRLSHHSR